MLVWPGSVYFHLLPWYVQPTEFILNLETRTTFFCIWSESQVVAPPTEIKFARSSFFAKNYFIFGQKNSRAGFMNQLLFEVVHFSSYSYCLAPGLGSWMKKGRCQNGDFQFGPISFFGCIARISLAQGSNPSIPRVAITAGEILVQTNLSSEGHYSNKPPVPSHGITNLQPPLILLKIETHYFIQLELYSQLSDSTPFLKDFIRYYEIGSKLFQKTKNKC